MGFKAFYNFYKRYENGILAFALLLVLLLFVGVRYDYYYDLNDDVTMKDMLSGVYTGEPEGHNIQMLYPLSLAISLCYRMFPGAPVYGAFLCLCQYGCLWLMVDRSLRRGGNTWKKIGMALAEGALFIALLLPHLVFVQYTFVSAMLAATAAFLFLMSEQGGRKGFFRKNLPSVLLAALSYMLRTEMLLLLLPLICVAGVYRWSQEEQVFDKDNVAKYLSVIGGILLGMLAAFGIHAVAFSGPEWKEYVEFFNSRTELYDFQGIPSYQGNEELYRELGLTESGQDMLLEQYNFGLEDALDSGDLDKIAQYQAQHQVENRTVSALFMEKLRLYRYRSFHKEPAGSSIPDDYPWNLFAVAGYVAVIGLMSAKNLYRKRFRGMAADMGKILFLFGVRTALWMFILMRGRDPVRITHSLYWMELCILSAMIYVETAALPQESRTGRGRIVLAAVLGGVALAVAGQAGMECMADTDKEYRARAVADTVDGGMKAYCRSHAENFYFFDVYSAVSYPSEPYQSTPYAEKVFADVDNRLGNYDLMGGWLVKSPSYWKKLRAFGMDSMREALLYREDVYLMAELEKGTEAFRVYFSEQGADVELELTDTICGIIGVYKIAPET